MSPKASPSYWGLKLFKWFCRSEYHRDIEGDLIELFYMNIEEKGLRKAKWILWKEIFLLFRSGIIRSIRKNQKLNIYDMVKHTFIFSLRSFWRHKSSFLINLTGLTSGLLCTFLIYLWIADELAIDRFHKNSDQLYQVMTNSSSGDDIVTGEATPHLLAKALEEEIPEVESAVSFSPVPNEVIFEANDEIKLKTSGHFASSDFFSMFSFQMLQGNPEDVLSDRSQIVISEGLALKLFNRTDAVVGKTLKWDLQGFSGQGFISGIFKDTNHLSTLQFDFIIHFSQFEDLVKTYVGELTWGSLQPYTYVALNEGVSAADVSQKIDRFLDMKTGKDGPKLFLRPFQDKYLYNTYKNGVLSGGRIEYVRLFSLIAVFIVLVACINFMNLSTAKATRRLKELGVKKAIGASKGALMLQYIGESVILAFISLVLAIGLASIILPEFNTITGKQIELYLSLEIVLVGVGLALLTGVLAGTYPAIFLSSMKTVTVLKGKIKNSKIDFFARKGLVTFQFVVSIALIVCVAVVYKQIEYIQSKNLGYEREHLVSFGKEANVAKNLELFLDQARQIPGISGISAISHNMTENGNAIGGLDWPGKDPELEVNFQFMAIDFGMIETLGIQMQSGRAFSEEFATDASKVIINETAVDMMGLQQTVGTSLHMAGNDYEILGVTKDFHFESLHETVKPTVMMILPEWTNRVIARIEGEHLQQTIDRLDAFYEEFNDGLSLDLRFLEDNYQALYQSENQIGTLSRYFAGFALIICFLGLLGLISFTAERRKKEIGIRKILGSKTSSIVYLLSRDFNTPVLIAIIIALPLSYWFASDWLSGFEYRIRLKWWFFAGAGLSGLFITWLTVGIQTIKSSRENPVSSLRSE